MIGRLLQGAGRAALFVASIVVAARRFGSSPSTPEPPARPEEPGGWPWTGLLKKWMLVGGVLLVLLGLAGGLVVLSGIVPIKASSGHWDITAAFLQFAKRRSVATHTIGLTAPPLEEPQLVLKGAGHYQLACRPCHGSPGFDQPRIARQMTPRPPDLRQTVPTYDPEALFYIVKHGIKLTGMPAWPAQQRDDEVWAMVAFLRRLPTLDAAAYHQLATGPAAAADAGVAMADLVGPQEVPPAITESCARCHGVDGLGRGVGAFPRLAGQRAAYLLATLQAYARGERHSGIMEPVAAGLGGDEMQRIALYYASLGGLALASGNEGTVADEDRGAEIASRGLPDRLVPPCSECHGPAPRRRNPHYPRLAGQYADYIMLQLHLFRTQSRGGTEYKGIMRKIAGQLTEDQIRAVARYYASLAPEADGPADPPFR